MFKEESLIMILLMMLITSCSVEELPSIIQPSNFSYPNDEVEIVFYSTGNSNSPTVDWGGEVGKFELESSISGISINEETGVLNWQGGVPLGENEIRVTAKNSAGSTSTLYIINQPFSGSFDGGYNFNPNSTDLTSNNYNLTFATDGTLTVRDRSSTGTGTWTFTTGNNMDISYTYTGSNSANVSGELNFSPTSNPSVVGIWTIPNSSDSGYLNVSLN